MSVSLSMTSTHVYARTIIVHKVHTNIHSVCVCVCMVLHGMVRTYVCMSVWMIRGSSASAVFYQNWPMQPSRYVFAHRSSAESTRWYEFAVPPTGLSKSPEMMTDGEKRNPDLDKASMSTYL